MKLGDIGDDVKQVQLALRDLGYQLKGTGYFGPATLVAVKDFQKRAGLEVDGIVGPKTLDALKIQKIPEQAAGAELQRPLWLVAALSWVGTKEQPGSKDSPIILNWAKGMGGDISKEYTHDSIPWCKLFWEQCITQSGLEGQDTLWALDAVKWGQTLKGPAVGATACYKRDGGGHINFIVGRDQHGNLMCVGGNQSDAVNVKPFDPSRVVKNGYRWPTDVPLPSKIGFNSLPIVRSDGKLSKNEA